MAGSLITMDVMIGEPGVEFQGGTFITPNTDGSSTQHVVKQGDALLLLSHKYHNVEPVTQGTRTVLVVELWEGIEKECSHRCTDMRDTCERMQLWHCNKACGYMSNSQEATETHCLECDGV